MYEYTARLIKVIDGDTIKLDVDLGFRVHTHVVVRLAGIDVKELKDVDGQHARDALTKLLESSKDEGDIVIQTRKQDKYGRWLAILWITGLSQSVNSWLVEQGYARVYE